jgi:hypothetical protein
MWKHYSNREIFGFFPVTSDELPVLSFRKRPEVTGKNPKISRPEYCFHIPVVFDAFLPKTTFVLRVPAGTSGNRALECST